MGVWSISGRAGVSRREIIWYEVLFVSSNGWDASAAAGYGFRTAWVNRAGEPVDQLPAKPDQILTDLTGIPDIAV